MMKLPTENSPLSDKLATYNFAKTWNNFFEDASNKEYLRYLSSYEKTFKGFISTAIINSYYSQCTVKNCYNCKKQPPKTGSPTKSTSQAN